MEKFSGYEYFCKALYLLLWAQYNLHSLKAVHVPGRLNQGVDMLSQGSVSSEEWKLNPQIVQMIWEVFRKAEVDRFASVYNSKCPTFSLKEQNAMATNDPMHGCMPFPQMLCSLRS